MNHTDVAQAPSMDLVVIAGKINKGLEAFEQRKADLTELKDQATGLKIESIDDKQSIYSLSNIRKKLKQARVDIEKEGKMMRDPLTAISKTISAKEKELVAIIEPTELELLKQEKWVESEKAKIQAEEAEKEMKRIQVRIDALAEYNYSIDFADIQAMSDNTFNQYLEAAKRQFEKEQAEKAELEKLRLENEAREKQEREAEAERMRKEREELEQLRQQQAAAQKIIDLQNAAIERDKKNMEHEKRAIQEAKDREVKEKQRLIEMEKAKKEAVRIAEEKRVESERKAKEAADRKAARAPDKLKIENYVHALGAVQVPGMKTKEGHEAMALIVVQLANLQDFAKDKVQQLDKL